MNSVLRRIQRFSSIVLEYSNSREILMSKLKGKLPTTVVLRNGLRIDSPESDTLLGLVDEIFIKKVYCPPFLPIDDGDVVVDIGANIGVFSLLASCKTRNTIYAYEPFPLNIEFLDRNVAKNGVRNVKSYSVAVSDRIGTARLFQAGISSGHLLFDHNITRKLERFIEVPTTTLETIMKTVFDENNREAIEFLKMDCEGAEGMVLMSTPVGYLQKIKKIAMEFHDNVSPLKHDEIIKLLGEAGFQTRLNWNGKSPFGYLYCKRG